MFGNLASMAAMLKQAKELQGNVKRIREELADTRFEAAAGGLVRAVVTGDMRVVSVEIAPDTGAAAGALAAEAVNAALDNAKTALQQRIREAAGGLDIPDLF